MNGNNVWWRVVLSLVLVAAVLGVAGLAFQAGVANGVAQHITVPANGTVPAPYYYGPHFFFGGFGGIVGLLIGLFVFFFVIRLIGFLVWGPHIGWRHQAHLRMHRYGPWGMGSDDPEAWSKGVPPPIAEWHRRLHEQGEPGKKD